MDEPVQPGEELVAGKLICVACAASYIIQDHIPRFVDQKNYSESFGLQWNIFEKIQLDSYTGLPISRTRLQEITNWPEELQGSKILEAGSGAGRFTEVLLAMGASVFSFDYSSAVNANWLNNGKRENLNLFQGDIYNIPLPKASFDKVLCLGVLQHTPNPRKALLNLATYVRPGGQLVIDIYPKTWRGLLSWKYLLRPITKRLNARLLLKIIEHTVPILLPIAILLRKLFGGLGARLLPIVQYSHMGLPYKLNKQWAVLDTFDMYSPAYDHPASIATVKAWLKDAGLQNIEVKYGPNGIIGKGDAPRAIARN
ncbi:methyltransferase domain-containing protein [Oligoflexia bacterium]|nr:methyltransferase domain-containing protein [Oligoflexia bacterium]